MKYRSELSRVLLGHKTYGRHLQVGNGGVEKGSATLPRATSLAIFGNNFQAVLKLWINFWKT